MSEAPTTPTTATEGEQEPEGVLEQVADDVADGAKRAATFVTRLGGAFSEGYSDGRARP